MAFKPQAYEVLAAGGAHHPAIYLVRSLIAAAEGSTEGGS
jgi:hypothetical protein